MRILAFLCFVAFANYCGVKASDEYDDPQTLPNRTVLVHLFEWKWTDIAKECEIFLSKYEYGAVQISPPNEHIWLDVNNDLPWYVRYQPVSYELKSRSGNEQELRDMVDRCNKVGVRVIADVVLNHMVGIGQAFGVNGIKSSGDNTFDGRYDKEQFPGVPYGPSDFNDPYCDHDIQPSDYQNSAYNVKTCRLSGLLDLDQGKEWVRSKIAGYLNYLIDIGFAGFRADASKHMWPDDLKNIFSRVNNLRSDIFGPEQRPFIVNEVIDKGGEAVNVYQYADVGRYTNFNFGLAVTQAMWRKSDISGLADLKEGFGYGNGNTNKVLNFIDNHDNQRDGDRQVLNYNDGIKYKMGVAFMLAWNYGYPRVMSSYYFNSHDQGPPNTGKNNDYATKSPSFDNNEYCEKNSGWVCEHRWSEIRQMVQFRHAATGADVVEIQRGEQMLAFARKNKGYIALRNSDYDYKLNNVQTTLPSGTYCDIVTGTKTDNKCTGTSITVGQNGVASFTIPPNSFVAFYVDTKLD